MIDVESLPSFDAEGRTPVFEDPHTVVLRLPAGGSVPAHTHPGRDILFSVFEGALDLSVGGETRRLEAGDFARFDGAREIAVDAREDVRALVVLAEA